MLIQLMELKEAKNIEEKVYKDNFNSQIRKKKESLTSKTVLADIKNTIT